MMDIAIVPWMAPMNRAQMPVPDRQPGQDGLRRPVVQEPATRKGVCKKGRKDGRETSLNATGSKASFRNVTHYSFLILDIATSSSSPAATFACPQQPKLLLPLSRLQDGICDCCDGADEAPGLCTDICGEVLKAEREARAKLEESFKRGQNKRKHELYAFKKLREEQLVKVQELEQQKDALNPEVPLQQANDLQLQYLKQRRELALTLVEASSKTEATGILAGLTLAELRSVIVLACQVAGEMAAVATGGRNDTSTCAALRLAGLEIGLTWKDDDYGTPEEVKTEFMDTSSVELAKRVFANAANGEGNWNLGGKSEKNPANGDRRRLQEEAEDDFEDYAGDMDDDIFGHDEDDDDLDDLTADEEEKGPLDGLEGLEKELMGNLRSLPFSTTRNTFLKKCTELLSEMSNALAAQSKKANKEAKEAVGEGETSQETETDAATTPTVDPAAYSMLRSSLKRKRAAVVKGLNWGTSAMLFFSANTEVTEEQVLQLAMYTIYHGNLSALQVWQILQVALDDFLVPPAASADEETCASPWAASCPPATIVRDGIMIPAASLVEVATAFCAGETDAAMEACSATTTDANGIPTSIPEGYYGYTTPVPRDQNDPVAKMFAPLMVLPVDKDGLAALENEKDRLEQDKRSLEDDIDAIWKDIGGKDGTDMGPNGELHSLANKCFDVLAGKYTYEVCVFGEAKQKEGPGNGGTVLGKFTRMEYDDETGERTLYWENGQKCWNGPHRSATVHLTCGAENKVLSADEPDTCCYVLRMESHIACDEHFKQRMGL